MLSVVVLSVVFYVLISVIVLNVNMLSVVMLSVAMLGVVAPSKHLTRLKIINWSKHSSLFIHKLVF